MSACRVLVMGGFGFIGSHLSRLLLRNGYEVRIFDRLFGSRNLIADVEEEVEVEEGDAEKPQDVIRAMRDVDIAIDLIHTTVPGASMDDPSYDILTNVVAHATWLSLLRETRLKRIIYISSGGTVYGVPQQLPIKENHPTHPISSYGITKLTIEKYLAMYANMYEIEYRICRPANVYGEWQRLNIGQGVIGVFLERCLKGQPIEIWGDGTTRRDYIYVTDLAQAIVRLIAHEGNSRVFNISSGVGHSLNDIIDIIRDELTIPLSVRYLAARKFDVSVNVLDNTLLRLETGWKPQINIVDGMRRVCKQLSRLSNGSA